MAKTFDLTAGNVKWKDISRHANKKACKPWAQKITGTHDKYGVDGEWLDKTWIDDKCHFDVSGLVHGDLIKVSGASHNNRKHAYYRVLSVNDELEVERLKEAEVIAALNDDGDGLDDLRAEIHELVTECESEEILRAIRAQL